MCPAAVVGQVLTNCKTYLTIYTTGQTIDHLVYLRRNLITCDVTAGWPVPDA